MKIGITQLLLGNMSLDDILGLCQEAGYDAVELTFGEGEGKDTDINMSSSELSGVGEKCAAAGIEISSTIANYSDTDLDSRTRALLTNAAESWAADDGKPVMASWAGPQAPFHLPRDFGTLHGALVFED